MVQWRLTLKSMLKLWVFKSFLKVLASLAPRTYPGRSFQILGPYTRKLRSPARFEVRGIVTWHVSDDTQRETV